MYRKIDNIRKERNETHLTSKWSNADCAKYSGQFRCLLLATLKNISVSG